MGKAMKLLLLALMMVVLKPSPDNLKERLIPTTRRTVHYMGNEIKIDRPYGIQMELMKEHLVWLNYNYSEKQIKIVQAITLHDALKRANQAIAQPTEEQAKQLNRIKLYRNAGWLLLEQIVKDIGYPVPDRVLRFSL
jgi:hypothetical protein